MLSLSRRGVVRLFDDVHSRQKMMRCFDGIPSIQPYLRTRDPPFQLLANAAAMRSRALLQWSEKFASDTDFGFVTRNHMTNKKARAVAQGWNIDHSWLLPRVNKPRVLGRRTTLISGKLPRKLQKLKDSIVTTFVTNFLQLFQANKTDCVRTTGLFLAAAQECLKGRKPGGRKRLGGFEIHF